MTNEASHGPSRYVIIKCPDCRKTFTPDYGRCPSCGWVELPTPDAPQPVSRWFRRVTWYTDVFIVAPVMIVTILWSTTWLPVRFQFVTFDVGNLRWYMFLAPALLAMGAGAATRFIIGYAVLSIVALLKPTQPDHSAVAAHDTELIERMRPKGSEESDARD